MATLRQHIEADIAAFKAKLVDSTLAKFLDREVTELNKEWDMIYDHLSGHGPSSASKEISAAEKAEYAAKKDFADTVAGPADAKTAT